MTAHRTPFAALALVAGLLASAAAPAADRVTAATAERAQVRAEGASVVVSYADLNLGSERGVRQLQRRLVAAARQVCGNPDPRVLQQAAQARACMDAAIARAVADVGNARLAQLNASRGRALRG